MMTTARLAAGKLPHQLLAELLADLPTRDPHLLVGPTVGEDAAVIDFAPGSETLLVAKTDPITFATDQIGYYAVNVCANDLAVSGATPRFYLPTLLLPAGQSDAALARTVFAQIGAACRAIGVVVAGGHSEVTASVQQVVVAGAMLGEVTRTRLVQTAGCRPGDAVLLAGSVPVEGVSIIARERRADLLARGWSPQDLDAAAGYLFAPGISVLRPALLAAEAALVTAMHDPTEGGLATALLEVAVAAGVGLAIDLDAIPVAPLAQRLCAEYGLDPLGTIASGALLATAAPGQVARLLALWAEHGWPAAVIGQVTRADAGLVATRAGRATPLPRFAVDEITKLWV
jgi:hydrogenase expression/formation protein HypE